MGSCLCLLVVVLSRSIKATVEGVPEIKWAQKCTFLMGYIRVLVQF